MVNIYNSTEEQNSTMFNGKQVRSEYLPRKWNGPSFSFLQHAFLKESGAQTAIRRQRVSRFHVLITMWRPRRQRILFHTGCTTRRAPVSCLGAAPFNNFGDAMQWHVLCETGLAELFCAFQTDLT